jgi:hypothetical protein
MGTEVPFLGDKVPGSKTDLYIHSHIRYHNNGAIVVAVSIFRLRRIVNSFGDCAVKQHFRVFATHEWFIKTGQKKPKLMSQRRDSV